MSKINTDTWLCGGSPRNGQFQRYPSRFMFNIRKKYPCFLDKNSLHLFSGSCEFGIGVDFRIESRADVVAEYNNLPFDCESFSNAIADPPYADHYQNQWHGELPKPKWILREMARVVKSGSLIGILHIIVIPAYKQLRVKRIAIHPVLCGPNNAVRVFNVFERL